MPTTFIPALNQARPIDWPVQWPETPSKRNAEHEKEITFTATERRKGRGGGENDESGIKDSFVQQKI